MRVYCVTGRVGMWSVALVRYVDIKGKTVLERKNAAQDIAKIIDVDEVSFIAPDLEADVRITTVDIAENEFSDVSTAPLFLLGRCFEQNRLCKWLGFRGTKNCDFLVANVMCWSFNATLSSRIASTGGQLILDAVELANLFNVADFSVRGNAAHLQAHVGGLNYDFPAQEGTVWYEDLEGGVYFKFDEFRILECLYFNREVELLFEGYLYL